MPNQTTPIAILRRNGFKVLVQHFRYNKWNGELKSIKELNGEHRATRGGKTVIYITNKDGDTFKGEAVCHEIDTFDRRAGIRIALRRAANNMKNGEKCEFPLDFFVKADGESSDGNLTLPSTPVVSKYDVSKSAESSFTNISRGGFTF